MATLTAFPDPATYPKDTELEGDGAQNIRLMESLVKERMALDHNFDGNLDTTNANCDGYHKKVTLTVQSSDPDLLATGLHGIIYSKTVDGTQGVYFRNSVGILRII